MVTTTQYAKYSVGTSFSINWSAICFSQMSTRAKFAWGIALPLHSTYYLRDKETTVLNFRYPIWWYGQLAWEDWRFSNCWPFGWGEKLRGQVEARWVSINLFQFLADFNMWFCFVPNTTKDLLLKMFKVVIISKKYLKYLSRCILKNDTLLQANIAKSI